MIRRWCIQCHICEDTDVAHEMNDGDMIYLEDIKPFINALYGTINFLPKEIEDAHNNAVKELKSLLT